MTRLLHKIVFAVLVSSVLFFTEGISHVSAAVPSSITTYAAYYLRSYGANMYMNVGSNGGFAITEHGIVYSTSNATPTIADSKFVQTNSPAAVSFRIVPVTGQSPSTFYYARAYATNASGTGYGNVITYTTDSVFSGSGTGTSGDPYQVTTCAQLDQMNNTKSAYYIQQNDIDCSATTTWNDDGFGLKQGFQPVGIGGIPNFYDITGEDPFTGSFNGNSHNISNLYINKFTSGWGLFGNVKDATISNVNVTSLHFVNNGASIIGGLAAQVRNTTISNCTASGLIETDTVTFYIGGLIGTAESSSTVTNSGSSVNQTYTVNAGNSYSIGGLVGRTSDGTSITGSSSTGNITGANSWHYLGGLVGTMDGTTASSITNSTSSGTLTAYKTSYSEGGFVGDLRKGSVTNSTSSVTINHGVIANTGTSGGSAIGGFVGSSYAGSTISLSNTTGTITAYGNQTNVGGFAGDSNGSITQSTATGNVNSSNWSDFVGGFIGSLYGSGSISQSLCTGNVSSYDDIGGFAGRIQNTATIQNSYSRSNVTSTIDYPDAYFGGFVASQTGGTIENSYSTGTVTIATPSVNLGGLVGNKTSGTVTSSYWDTESSGIATSTAGSGLTTAQLKDSSNLTGWDFATIWRIDPTYNNGYPGFLYLNPVVSTPTPTPTPTVAPTSAPAVVATSTPVNAIIGAHADCNQSAPPGAPNLFMADRTGNKVTLSFSPVNTNTTGYNISYGFFPGDERYSISFNSPASSGVLTYEIKSLESKQAYTFKIRAINDCVPGPWSNNLSVNAIGKNNTTTPTPKPKGTPIPSPSPAPIPAPAPTATPTSVPVAAVVIVIVDNTGGPISDIPVTIVPKDVIPSPSPSLTETSTPTPEVLGATTDHWGQIDSNLTNGNYVANLNLQDVDYQIPFTVENEKPRIVVEVPATDTRPTVGNIAEDITSKSVKTITAGAAAVATSELVVTTAVVSKALVPVYEEAARPITKLPFDLLQSIYLKIIHMLASFGGFFVGFVRKRKSEGAVFDSKSSKPQSGAYMILFSKSGNLKTGFSDSNGEYILTPRPDTYQLRVEKISYLFPSKLISVASNYIYHHIYLPGEEIVVKSEGEKVNHLGIPLDPDAKTSVLGTFYIKAKNVVLFILDKLSLPTMFAGIVISGVAVYFNPSVFYKTVFATFIVSFILHFVTVLSHKKQHAGLANKI